MNPKSCPSSSQAIAGACLHCALWPLACHAAMLVGALYMLALGHEHWAVALASFTVGLAAATAWRAGVVLVRDRFPCEISKAAEKVSGDPFLGHGIWQEIDDSRDLLHLLNERARLPSAGRRTERIKRASPTSAPSPAGGCKTPPPAW